MATRIQYRRDTAANWSSLNPVLGAGEPGLETDSGLSKLGNGSTSWTSLPYQAPVFRPENYGTIGASASQDTAALNACFAAAAAAGSFGGPVELASRTYNVNAALTYASANPRVRGAGASKTILSFTANTFDYLTLGTGTISVTPSGYVRDFAITGPSAAPSSGHSGLVLNGVIQAEISGVKIDNQDIGFDLINNCFGTQFTNIRAGFGGSLNVGVNLRTGTQSGSDIAFFNPWVNGRIAGMHVSGGGGGYHVSGGQVTAGQGTSSANDLAGAIVVGKDYLTGSTGEATIDLYGTSFEGTNYAHCIRTFDLVKVNAQGVYFTPQASGTPAIQAVKATNAQNSTITLAGHVIGGYWSATQLVSVAGDYDDFYFGETDPMCAGNQPYINGTQVYVRSLTEQSAITSTKFSVRRGGYNLIGTLKFSDGTSQTTAGGGGTVSDATTSAKGIVQLAGDLAGTAASPTVPGLASKTNVVVDGSHVAEFDVSSTAVVATDIGAKPLLVAQAVSTATTGTLAVSTINPLNAASANLARTLPTPTIVGQEIEVEKTDASVAVGASTGVITVTGTIRGATSSVSLYSQYQTVGFVAESLTSWRPTYDHRTKTALDQAYAPVTTKGDVLAATGSAVLSPVSVGSDGQILIADSTQTAGIKWGAAPASGIQPSVATAKGDILAATAAATIARVGIGGDGTVLTADSTQGSGMRWLLPSGGGSGSSTFYIDGGSATSTYATALDGGAAS